MIDYIILTNTRTEKDYKMTMDLVRSLQQTEYPKDNGFEAYRITIVENNKGSGGFDYPKECVVVNYDVDKYKMFNYNYALNIGCNYCLSTYVNTDWFCIFNNDVVCDKDWILEISKAVSTNPAIESVGPNPRQRSNEVLYGYQLFKHMDGCCIMHRKNVLDKIGLWDESFDFAYQDDDYLERCRRAKIVHARVMSSIIHHLGSATMDYTTELAVRGMKAFIAKWSYQTFCQREAEKKNK